MQKWPIRVPRPVHHRYSARVPLVTGQRVMDTMFPLAKGGTAAIPGGFGTGKTMRASDRKMVRMRTLLYISDAESAEMR